MEDTIGRATYSPEDNKLRIYPDARLEPDVYARVKEAGFSWAPKQELFVAPMWTPYRESLLIELCGEIEDEDTSLVERAEAKAERLEDLSDRRAGEADAAHKAVARIADNIPLGQPILVGHHSEKHARRDAAKIENGMRRAVNLWEQSEYYKRRAKGAIRLAKYKERPDVRARRIKGLEADKRKQERTKAHAEMCLKFWRGELKFTNKETGETRTLTRETAIYFCNLHDHISREFKLAEYPRNPPASQYEGQMGFWSALGGSDGPEHAVITAEQAQAIAIPAHTATVKRCERWIRHYENRLVYERAMLEDAGGLAADAYNFEVGGRALNRGEWATITRVNRKDGQVTSVRTNARYCSLWPVEEIKGYEPPTAEQAEATKAAVKPAPLCNFPGEGFLHMTKDQMEHAYGGRWIDTFPASGEFGAYRMQSKYKGGNGLDCHNRIQIFVTDAKVKYPPKVTPGGPVEKPKVEPARKAWPVAKTLDELNDAMFSHYDSGKIRAGIKYEYSGEGVSECYQFDTLQELQACAMAYQQEPRMVRFQIVTHTGEYKNMRGVYAWDAGKANKLAFNRDVQFTRATAEDFKRLAETLKAGVKVVSAPQLFPTPPDVCERMVELAEIESGMRVLEPSAGTGNIVQAIINTNEAHPVVAIEINQQLADHLQSHFPLTFVSCCDFLSCNGSLGRFDRVLMNPPFENGADIKHIKHALTMLKPGGRLVGICANGPRQQERIKPMAESWEVLDAGTFAGTGVTAAMFVIDKAESNG